MPGIAEQGQRTGPETGCRLECGKAECQNQGAQQTPPAVRAMAVWVSMAMVVAMNVIMVVLVTMVGIGVMIVLMTVVRMKAHRFELYPQEWPPHRSPEYCATRSVQDDSMRSPFSRKQVSSAAPP